MKKVLIKILAIIFLIGGFSSCKERIEIDPDPTEFSDISISDIEVFSAKVSVDIIKSSKSPISDHGFVFSSTNENPETSEENIIKKGAIEPTTPTPITLTSNLTELESKTEYFVRAYVVTSFATFYSETVKFTTTAIKQPAVKTDDAKSITHNSAKLNGSITAKGTYKITEYGIVWDTKTNPTTSVKTKSSVKGDITKFPASFSADAKNLEPNTTYNYRAYVIMNDTTTYGENKTFKTGKIIQPEVVTGAANRVNHDSALLLGSITKAGTYPVSEYGIVWATKADPTTSEKTKYSVKSDISKYPAEFSNTVKNLNPNTTYNYRAYVISNGVTTYGTNKTFKTDKIVQPEVATGAANRINHDSALLLGSIDKAGTNPVSEYGIVWSTKANPTTSEKTKYSVKSNISKYPTEFNTTAKSLSPNTTYNYRAYVISGGVTTYGVNKTFKTTPVAQPEVVTGTASEISNFSARLAGSIEKAGSYAISERGVVWATKANPTTSDQKVAIKGDVTKVPDKFSVEAKDLKINTTYNYRAYVISNGKTTYGENKTFTTLKVVQPEISTEGASEIGINSARLSGRIKAGGTYPISERGIVWSKSANPTTSDSKASISGNVGSFPNNYSVDAKSLELNTTYNYRAYVISNGTTTYGENKTFKTLDFRNPEIQTVKAEPSDKSAKLYGKLVSKGSHAITEYGICWNTSANPTTSNSKAKISGDVSSFPKDYTVQASNLNPETTYHYRAYVIMDGKVTYGANQTFKTTVATPDVVTGNVSIESTIYTLNGKVNNAGTYSVTEMGIVYGPTSNPTTSNTKLSKSGSGVSYPASFQFQVRSPNFSENKAYYYRAYAISNGKTYYGTSKLLRDTPPVLSTGSNKDGYSPEGLLIYTLSGAITSMSNLKVKEYGIVWGLSDNPTVSANKVRSGTSVANNPVNFSVTVLDRSIGTCKTTYYRAYAITTDGVTYYANNSANFKSGGCIK